MKKTNFIMKKQKVIEGQGLGVRIRVGFLLFYYELAPLTCDVTCSKLYFGGKKI